MESKRKDIEGGRSKPGEKSRQTFEKRNGE